LEGATPIAKRTVGSHDCVRGACKRITKNHPAVPEHLRGTYAGLASKPVIEFIKSLGVTSVDLLPIHAFINDSHLLDKGLTNYWGYNSIGFFAPDTRYASAAEQTLREFKEMVACFHGDAPWHVLHSTHRDRNAAPSQAGTICAGNGSWTGNIPEGRHPFFCAGSS
jgi:isoamylase